MTAPSFPSFPPSFGSFPNIEDETRFQNTCKSFQKKDEFKSSKNKRHREKEAHSSSKRRRKERYDHREANRTDYNNDDGKKHDKSTETRQGGFESAGEPGLYVVDKRGDYMNVVYGGLHVGDIPKYKRFGHGNILGLPLSLKIVVQRLRGSHLEISVNGGRPLPRYIESRSHTTLTSIQTRLLSVGSSRDIITQHDRKEAHHAEFIPFTSRKARVAQEELFKDHFLKIKDNYSDSETGTDSNDSNEISVGPDHGEEISLGAEQQAIAELEISLQKTPSSVPLWLSLIDRTLSSASPSNNLSMTKARSEVRLSILDRAMRACMENRVSVLRIMWLKAGINVWDDQKQENEWEIALSELGREGISSNTIWDEWFRWRVSNAGRQSYGQANLQSILNDAKRLIENLKGELAKVKALWETAMVLKDAGFLERAMALFQAQVELSFRCPNTLSGNSLLSRLDALEEFWEAEVPRAGESDALGWDIWDSERMSGNSASAVIDGNLSQMDGDKSSDPYLCWAVNEINYAISSTMPKRTTDALEEDPYAIVLFSDIRLLLFDIQAAEARHGLRLAWLNFIGMHIPGLTGFLSQGGYLRDDVWAQNHFTRKPYMRHLFPDNARRKEQSWHAVAGTVIAKEVAYGHVFGCVKEWGKGVLSPVEAIDSLAIWNKDDTDGIDKILVRHVFEQLRNRSGTSGIDDEEWDLLAIAFEAAINLKSALKLSQTLLSTARSSLIHWGAHARLERIRNKVGEARKIYQTTLANTDSTLRGAAQLWRDWAEMEWLDGDDDQARIVIQLSTESGNVTSAMSILRCKRVLEDRARGSFHWKDREAWVCLRALLEVLVGGAKAIAEGMHLLQRYVDEWNLQGVQKESAWTNMLLLEWKHTVILRRQVKRGEVRMLVGGVLRQLQDITNTVILGIFLEGEKGESVWGRVRALSSEAEAGGSQGVVRTIWQIWLASWESWKWEAEKERLRVSLGVAVNEDRTKASPILWRIYIEFEIYCGELKRAKSLLFRAVADCPLVKELYLLAFGPLRTVFTAAELDVWGETMAERGLRLYHGLEEYVELGRATERNSWANDIEDAGELELEEVANEYRRLAPF